MAFPSKTDTVSYLLPDKLGGITNYVENLLAYRRPDGMSYHVVLTDNIGSADDRSDGVLSADSVQRFVHDSPRENLHAVVRRLAKALPTGGGVLVINDLLPLAMVSVCDTRKAVVNITHADSDYYYGLATRHEPVIDAFVTYTPFMYQRLIALLPHRSDSVFLLPYGVHIPAASRTPQPGPLRLLYVGRLVRQKGVFDLPEIDKILRDRGIPCAWTIQGCGPDEEALKRVWGNPAIRWCGRQPHERVLGLYPDHDVLVMPSRSEGLPVALLEAAAAGVVPVVSDLATGIPDLVKNGETGFRPAVGDIAEFASAIGRLEADRESLEIMSRKVREVCQAKYNIVERVGGYQDLYANWRELRRPRPVGFNMQYGSRLDKAWLPNWLVKMLRNRNSSGR